MFKYTTLALCLISLNAFAHTSYVGIEKKSQHSCFLTIENSYYEGEETRNNLRIDVTIALADDHDHDHGHEQFHITLKPGATSDLYSGMRSNGKDQLNVFSSSTETLNPSMYAFRWLHGNHFHTAQCLNLNLENHTHE